MEAILEAILVGKSPSARKLATIIPLLKNEGEVATNPTAIDS